MDAMVRIGLAAALIFVAFALGMLLLTNPAFPQQAPSCARPLAMVEGEPGWRVLHGDDARDYIELAIAGPPIVMAVAAEADAIAYARLADKVGIALSRRGCITMRRVVPLLHHNRVLDKVLGILT